MFGTPCYLTKALGAFQIFRQMSPGKGESCAKRVGDTSGFTTRHRRKAKRDGVSIFKLSASPERSAGVGFAHALSKAG
jgi:hypothetical protein